MSLVAITICAIRAFLGVYTLVLTPSVRHQQAYDPAAPRPPSYRLSRSLFQEMPKMYSIIGRRSATDVATIRADSSQSVSQRLCEFGLLVTIPICRDHRHNNTEDLMRVVAFSVGRPVFCCLYSPLCVSSSLCVVVATRNARTHVGILAYIHTQTHTRKQHARAHARTSRNYHLGWPFRTWAPGQSVPWYVAFGRSYFCQVSPVHSWLLGRSPV